MPRRSCFILAAAVLLLTPAASRAQNALRRGAPIQPVALAHKGDLLLGAGAAYGTSVTVPLIAVEGDLTRLGILDLIWAPGDGVILEVRGDAYRALTIDTIGDNPPVPPDEGVADGKSTGAGDFTVGISFRALGGGEGLTLGGRFEFNIPDSNQAEGLGTNTTNIRMTVLGGYASGPLVITGDLGVGILEAPLENFEQNDVVAYSAELFYRFELPARLRLFAGLYGHASTRGEVPIGTEDQGEVSFGADLKLGRWLFDFGGLVGYAGNSPDWGVGGGVSLTLGSEH